MASSYRVNWSIGEGTDPTLPGKDAIIVPDGTVDSTSTTLPLTGRNVPVYGEIQQENFIRLMENFANTTPPVQATVGQLWFDSDYVNGNGSVGALKIYRKSYPSSTPLLNADDEDASPSVNWHLVNNPVEILGYRPVDATGVSGDTMAGPLVLPGIPTQANQAATKGYVDAVASGLSVRDHVVASTTSNLSATYANGSADASGGTGIGATLTATANGALVVDGYSSFSVSDRVLVKNQTNPIYNGIYTITAIGSLSTPWVLTRATDYDNSVAGQVAYGDYLFVGHGSTLAGTGWVMTTTGTAGDDVVKIGTDAIQFTQYSAAGAYTAGSGINITGPTITNTGVRSVASSSTITVSSTTGDGVSFSVVTPVASAVSATNATNSTNSEINADNTNASFFPVFVSGTTGDLPLKVDSDLSYNPNTNTLSVANFVGALTGNATTATSATTASKLAGGALGSIPYQLSSGNTTFLGIGSNNEVLTVSGGVPTWGPAAGTVFSVGLAAPSIFSVSGSPVTSSGTLTLSLASQTAKTFFAAPNASAGTPSFRAIVASDVPTLNQNTTGNAATSTLASTLQINGAGAGTFHWSGQSGQPSWLWGSNDGVNQYVWNPSNFSVSQATSATNATNASFSTTQPSGTNNTSIATTAFVQAALSSIVGGSKSLSSNGYITLPGGLIVQWGYVFSLSTDHLPVTFPIAFPSAAVAAVCCTNRSNSGASSGYNFVYNLTTTGATFLMDSRSGVASGWGGYWIAIGY